MTKEDKSLLLQDLCARLPYGVKVQDELGRINKLVIGNADLARLYYNDFSIYGEKALSLPLLRPMSSMTEEEKKEYDSFLFDNLEKEDVIGYEDKAFGVDVIMRYRSWEVVQWLLEHHLDFNGLIDLGLALEASEGMYEH